MYCLYDSNIIAEEAVNLSFTNRAFQYNDGLFDTLIINQGTIRFLPDHLERVQLGLQALHIQVPLEFKNPEVLTKLIQQLVDCNNLDGKLLRLKIHVWRRTGGLFTPEHDTAESLITVREQPATSAFINKVGVAKTVQNHYSALSFFKGPMAAHYVLASLEKKQRKVDELILLDHQGYVSEVLVANLFWIKYNVLFTPALATGCIAGRVRKNIHRLSVEHPFPLQEGFFTLPDLLLADVVFTSNVTGLRLIHQIEETTFGHHHPIVTKLNHLLFPD